MKKMKNIIILVIILVMSTTMYVMAVGEAETKFETDLSVCEKGELSVYRQGIRENIKGEWADCDCSYLCFCASLYHVLEDSSEEDFYAAFFKGDYFIHPLGKVYQDCSSSMEETFAYERFKIIENLSIFLNEEGKEIENVFKNQKTDLYGLLGSLNKEIMGDTIITMLDDIPIIITDLWNTAKEQEDFRYDGEIIFCVPFASVDKQAVLHCEDFVNNLLWNHNWIPASMSVYVVYTDEVIVEYTNCYHNGFEGDITIYVP